SSPVSGSPAASPSAIHSSQKSFGQVPTRSAIGATLPLSGAAPAQEITSTYILPPHRKCAHRPSHSYKSIARRLRPETAVGRTPLAPFHNCGVLLCSLWLSSLADGGGVAQFRPIIEAKHDVIPI